MRSLRQIMQNQLDELNPINRRNGMVKPGDWITNAPEYAAMLNDADTNFEKRKRAASCLPLEGKIIALREARKQLAIDYDAISALAGGGK